MNIVCATDFSQPSQEVFTMGKKIAHKLQDALILTHVSTYTAAMPDVDSAVPYSDLCTMCEEDLKKMAEREPRGLCPVSTKLLFGDVGPTLAKSAATSDTRFLLVGTHREPSLPWLFGDATESIIKSASSPVLVVGPHARSLDQWAESDRPLRALVAIDNTTATSNMVRWLEDFREKHSMDVTLLQCRTASNDQSVLAHYVGGLRGWGTVETVEEDASMDVGKQIADMASGGGYDIVVLGTHHRSILTRWMHPSVARDAARYSVTPVLIVPNAHHMSVAPYAEPRPKHVLAGTDFTDTGNRAVAVAYGLAGPGGTVDICHVSGPEVPESEVLEKLSRLVLDSSEDKHVTTQLHSLRGRSIASTLVDAANRLHADAICIAPRNHWVSWNSITRSLVQQSHRPVYVVPEMPT